MLEERIQFENINNSNDENDSMSINSEKSNETSFSYSNMGFINSLLDKDEININYNQTNINHNLTNIWKNPYMNNANNYKNNNITIQHLNQLNLYYQYLFINCQIKEYQIVQFLMNRFYNNETNIINKSNANISQKMSKKNVNKKKSPKTNCEKHPPKPENIIHIQKILSGEESRTFVRLNPIPNRYSPYDIIMLIDKYLKTKKGKRIYNSIYVPLAKVIGKNKGYCFINLVNPKYVVIFYEIFNGLYFNINNCKKPCVVVFSDKQEIDCSNDDALKRPILFNDCVKN